MNPLRRFDDRHIALLPPQYMAATGYYAVMAAYGRAVIDTAMTANKRFKSAHRCDIIDTQGPLSLTVPVNHQPGRRSWDETAVSAHGRWWHIHRVSLESAYGRTPFFEFYYDRFKPLLSEPGTVFRTIAELDMAADSVIRQILGIDTRIASEVPQNVSDAIIKDYRSCDFKSAAPVEYYQVRSSKFGFVAGLSVLDLIFNVGPESPLVLKEIIDRMFPSE